MERLPLETQTLYAELLERLMAVETRRTIGRAPGSFTDKTVKGESYCYFQYSEPGGGTRQIYVGRKTPALMRVIARFEKERAEFGTDREDIQRLCAQLRADWAQMTDVASARVLRALADAGVFQLGGVLVGTHAFTVLGNMLGTRWSSSALRTQDVAMSHSLSVVVPSLQTDVPKALESLEMGSLPVPALDIKHPSTSFKVRGKSLRVDILTPQGTSRSSKPVVIDRFNVAAQPLAFLDYLIEGAEPAAVVDGGGVLVQVPTPARFVLHKLLVSRERKAALHGKGEKDLAQAAQLLSLLAEERPGDLALAWRGIEKRGSGWVRRTAAGLVSIKRVDSQAYTRVCDVLPVGRETTPSRHNVRLPTRGKHG